MSRARAAEDVKAGISVIVEHDADAVVAELFTSQGCSSCPPAQAFLGDLARRADVIALEMHVDYWDSLKTTFAGSWKDPFSNPVWSQRQADYNKFIMGGESVYTPQMIIDGRLQDAGARRSSINALIEQARTLKKAKYKISTQVKETGAVTVTVEGSGIPDPVQVVLARIEKESVTEVRGGENKGATIGNHNIVKDMMVIGTWAGGKEEYKSNVSAFKAGEGCAVLLQDPDTMHILAGGMCKI